MAPPPPATSPPLDPATIGLSSQVTPASSSRSGGGGPVSLLLASPSPAAEPSSQPATSFLAARRSTKLWWCYGSGTHLPRPTKLAALLDARRCFPSTRKNNLHGGGATPLCNIAARRHSQIWLRGGAPPSRQRPSATTAMQEEGAPVVAVQGGSCSSELNFGNVRQGTTAQVSRRPLQQGQDSHRASASSASSNRRTSYMNGWMFHWSNAKAPLADRGEKTATPCRRIYTTTAHGAMSSSTGSVEMIEVVNNEMN